jgi:ABC-type sugar transport system substrate-binding protein
VTIPAGAAEQSAVTPLKALSSTPIDRRTALRSALRAVGAMTLCGGLPGALVACGKTVPAVFRTDFIFEYAGVGDTRASPPLGDLVRLVTARARTAGVQPVLSPAEGTLDLTPPADLTSYTANQVEVDPATGKHPPKTGVAVAGPFRPAAMAPVAVDAAKRGVKLVSYLVPFEPRAAMIAVDAAALGALLAAHAASWARGHAGHPGVLLVEPTMHNEDAFSQSATVSMRALRSMLARLAPDLRIVGSVAADVGLTSNPKVAKRLRSDPDVRLVLCWSDDTALGVVKALRSLHPAIGDDFYVGGLGTPALTSRATIDELQRGDVLRAVIAARPKALADAIVDLSHALLRGTSPGDIHIEPQTLTRGSAALAAHAADYSSDPGSAAIESHALPLNLNPIAPGS